MTSTKRKGIGKINPTYYTYLLESPSKKKLYTIILVLQQFCQQHHQSTIFLLQPGTYIQKQGKFLFLTHRFILFQLTYPSRLKQKCNTIADEHQVHLPESNITQQNIFSSLSCYSHRIKHNYIIITPNLSSQRV